MEYPALRCLEKPVCSAWSWERYLRVEVERSLTTSSTVRSALRRPLRLALVFFSFPKADDLRRSTSLASFLFA